jgi:hypothetical protein
VKEKDGKTLSKGTLKEKRPSVFHRFDVDGCLLIMREGKSANLLTHLFPHLSLSLTHLRAQFIPTVIRVKALCGKGPPYLLSCEGKKVIDGYIEACLLIRSIKVRSNTSHLSITKACYLLTVWFTSGKEERSNIRLFCAATLLLTKTQKVDWLKVVSF